MAWEVVGFLWAVLGTWNQRWGNRGGNSERDTQEEVETGGARAMKGSRERGVALHSVLLRFAIDTQLCPNSFIWPSSLSGL